MAVCWRTGRSSKASTYYRLLRPGSFGTAQSSEKARTSSHGSGRTRAPLEPESYYRELRDVFARNLPRYFNGQERIGMSLTGGLDTRMIMAWQKLPPGSLRCYTFGGMFRECRDVHVARQVASVCQQPYNVIPVGDEFLSRFPHYAERSLYLTDGCVDVSRSPDLYRQREGPRDRPGADDGTLRRRDTPPSPGIQAGGARTRLIPS